jgi:hypothetical protein
VTCENHDEPRCVISQLLVYFNLSRSKYTLPLKYAMCHVPHRSKTTVTYTNLQLLVELDSTGARISPIAIRVKFVVDKMTGQDFLRSPRQSPVNHFLVFYIILLSPLRCATGLTSRRNKCIFLLDCFTQHILPITHKSKCACGNVILSLLFHFASTTCVYGYLFWRNVGAICTMT